MDANNLMELQTTSASRAFTRQDLRAQLGLLIFFSLMLAATWQRWTQPLIDHGREMNLPARILAGEQLYVDVQFLYGPFAPYFNAFLYRLFGVNLHVLRLSGAICAMLILLMIYWLARQLMSVWEATLATGMVLVICAIKSSANYISPYAYAALYALVFALCSLIGTIKFVGLKRAHWMIWAGLFAGLAVISKPELALAAMAAAGAGWLVACLNQRKLLWREALAFALPVIIIAAAAYGFILSRVPWRVLLEDNHILFTNMPPQLHYFNRQVSGFSFWPASFWFSLAGLGAFLMWVGGSAALGALFTRREPKWLRLASIGVGVLLIGLIWRTATVYIFQKYKEITPFAAAVFLLPVTLIWAMQRIRRTLRAQAPAAGADQVLLVMTAFALAAILRGMFFLTISGPYTPFFLPMTIVLFLYLLFRLAPALLTQQVELRRNTHRAALALVAFMVVGLAVNTVKRLRFSNTYPISYPRGSFITESEWGEPLDAAIRYAREHTQPDQEVLSIPQATTINFLAERRYPFREEIVHPGFLTGEKELAAIELIKSHRIPLIMVINFPTAEFRDRAFGEDYNQALMRWVAANYHLSARFDTPKSREAKFGDKEVFILAYERNQ